MAFARNQHNITALRQSASRTNGFFAVGDAQHLTACFGRNTSLHLADDGFGFFRTWIVAGQDHLIAVLTSHFRHGGPFGPVAITTTTDYGQHFGICFAQGLDGFQHFFQGIRRMGVVNDCCDLALGVEYIVEAAFRCFELAQLGEGVYFVLFQQNCRGIHCQEVVGIELTDQAAIKILIVNVQMQPR